MEIKDLCGSVLFGIALINFNCNFHGIVDNPIPFIILALIIACHFMSHQIKLLVLLLHLRINRFYEDGNFEQGRPKSLKLKFKSNS